MMDKEMKMALLEELMREMDDSSLSKFKPVEELFPEDDGKDTTEEEDGQMVKIKEMKVDEVPVEKAPEVIEDKIADAMKKDGESEEEEDEDMGGSSFMEKIRKAKKMKELVASKKG